MAYAQIAGLPTYYGLCALPPPARNTRPHSQAHSVAPFARVESARPLSHRAPCDTTDASVLPLYLYAVFGTSRQLAVGPVALVSLLVEAGLRYSLRLASPHPIGIPLRFGTAHALTACSGLSDRLERLTRRAGRWAGCSGMGLDNVQDAALWARYAITLAFLSGAFQIFLGVCRLVRSFTPSVYPTRHASPLPHHSCNHDGVAQLGASLFAD